MSGSRKNILTIGSFDGVHRGHAAILQQLVQTARQEGGTSMVITFDPHPRAVLQPDSPPPLLTPLAEKRRLLQEQGIEEVVVVPFNKVFASLDPQAYIRDFLVARFHPHTIVIGYDHHFGANRQGNINTLRAGAAQHGYEVAEIPAEVIEEAAVSSTQIRKALQNGDLNTANKMLGRPYRVGGSVESGKQIGRTIGFPTANIALREPLQLLPAEGVYACRVQRGGHLLAYGITNIGRRPTVEAAGDLKMEVHLLGGFNEPLYGQELEVDFIARLRGEQKFESIDALKAQLFRDKAAAEAIFQGRP